VLLFTVATTFTVDSTMETFSEDAFKDRLASSFNMPTAAITLTVAAGSVVVQATMVTTDTAHASRVTSVVDSFAATPATASALLGVTVTTVVPPAVTTAFVTTPPPLSPPSSPPPPPLPPTLPVSGSPLLNSTVQGQSGGSDSDSDGAIVGVGIGIGVAGVLLLCVAVFLIHRHIKNRATSTVVKAVPVSSTANQENVTEAAIELQTKREDTV
jgi:hypothetical protein